MRRLVAIPLALAILAAAPAVWAAKPVDASATVSIDDATPVYGQTVILTATVDFGSSDDPAQIRTRCDHASGSSFGFSHIEHETTITDDVGLYAPNWPESPATCTATVVLLEFSRHGLQKRATPIGSLTFEVAA